MFIKFELWFYDILNAFTCFCVSSYQLFKEKSDREVSGRQSFIEGMTVDFACHSEMKTVSEIPFYGKIKYYDRFVYYGQ